LKIQKENLQYESFIQRHFKIKKLLEKVSEECFSVEEKENTKELIQRMYQDETGLMGEIEIWLTQFYKS